MSKIELTVRIIAKLLLIAGIIVLLAAGCMVESNCKEAFCMIMFGTLLSAPDLIIWWIDGLRAWKGVKDDRNNGRIEG